MRVFENRDEILREQISPNELIYESAKNRKNLSKEPNECNFYESADNVPDPKWISPGYENLMIFDDLLLQKQKQVWSILRSWKAFKLWLFVFESKLFQIALSNNSRNANFFCLSPQDQKNIDHIFNDHVSQDMTKEQFKNLCKTARPKPHNFAVIDLTSPKNCGIYRSGFDEFYII